MASVAAPILEASRRIKQPAQGEILKAPSSRRRRFLRDAKHTVTLVDGAGKVGPGLSPKRRERCMRMFDRIRRGPFALPRQVPPVGAMARTRRGWDDIRFLLKLRWRALLRGLDRRHLRSNEIALTALGIVVGGAIGIGVVIVHQLSLWLHE
ncbi:MAG: hypothetical protein KGJ66_14105, partial [Alphaproteobacteria bacterium]|nr:hypothetical protein [Alphaproteobacteria bacterium]